MAPAPARELMREKKVQYSCLLEDPWWRVPLVHHLMTSRPLPRWGGTLWFPALLKKTPRNPGDLINLHFPPAGLCRVPVSLCSITSLHLRNETSCGKASCWARLTRCVHVCVKKNQPACMHEQTGGFTSPTLWTRAVSVKQSFKTKIKKHEDFVCSEEERRYTWEEVISPC